MSTSFQGRVTQIVGDFVQIWDAASGHSLFLERDQIVDGEAVRLGDMVVVGGDEGHRHARRVPRPHVAA
ncbi:MAG: hypothetical protein AAFX81_01205 [Pseudomonadota bacterium]